MPILKSWLAKLFNLILLYFADPTIFFLVIICQVSSKKKLFHFYEDIQQFICIFPDEINPNIIGLILYLLNCIFEEAPLLDP